MGVRWIGITDRWPGRARSVAQLVPAGSSVIDLGAGAQGLRLQLPRDCTYTPVDLPEFDMNRGRWPDGRYDVAIMAGVLEYARWPGAAFRHLHALAPMAIITYSHGGRRRDPAWVNDLTADEIVVLAAKAGFSAMAAGSWKTEHVRPQTIWLLRSV
jgi:hypothetical protein